MTADGVLRMKPQNLLMNLRWRRAYDSKNHAGRTLAADRCPRRITRSIWPQAALCGRGGGIPNLDIDVYLDRIDELAAHCGAVLRQDIPPTEAILASIIICLMNLVFRHRGRVLRSAHTVS